MKLLLLFCTILQWVLVNAQCSGGFNLEGKMYAVSSYSCSANNFIYREGCYITVQCKMNYYFTDKESGRNGQRVTCSGGRWKVNGREPETTCRPGCVGLRDDIEMKNATYVSVRPPSNYYNGDLVIWPANTAVKTKCKEGFLFRHKYNQEAGTDDYKCYGGDEGWTDNSDPNERTKTGMGKAPGLCNPLCAPLDKRDFPLGVKLFFDPLNNPKLYKEDAKGNKLLVPSATYVFKCDNGYKYADGKEKQSLLCKGGTEGYEDADTNKRSATIKQCISNGCPPITSTNVDPSAQIERVNCTGTEVSNGCEVTIKCKKPTHYFSNPLLANGYKLKCSNGEWVDQSGQPVKPNSEGSFTDPCLGGCPVFSSSEMANTEYSVPAPTGSSNVFNNGDQQIYAGGVRVTTKCKDGFARPNEKDRKSDPISFTCDANSNAWTNTATGERGSPSTCQSGCKLSNAAEGTRYSNVPDGNMFTSNGQKYATLGSRLIVQCNTDYEDPKTKSPSTTQTLMCKGENNGGWVEEGSQLSAQPMTCVRSGAKGCDVASLNNADATKDNCEIIDGLMPENCKLTIKCKEGYIPSDPTAVDGNGEQSLVCVAKNDGWKDSKTGKTKVAPVKCVPVCTFNDPLEKAEYVKKVADSDVITFNGKKYVKQGTTVSIKCKDPYVGKTDSDREGTEIEYLCKGGSDGWHKPKTSDINRTPGDSCGALCDPLNNLPTGTLQIINPQVFEYNGEPKVSEGGRYRFKCGNGFKYPDGTPEAAANQQILVCAGDKKGYVVEGNNATQNVQVLTCVRGSSPGCDKLDVSNPPPGLNVTQSSGCALSNDKTSVGCNVNIECASGFFPSTTTSGSQPKQALKCVDNGTSSSWVDTNTNVKLELLKCEPGCPALGVSPNSVLVTGSTPSINTPQGQFFAVGSKVTVKCADGSVHRSGSTENPSENMEYVCRGGSASPWSNSKYPGFEKLPGDGCLRTCIAAQLPPGMRATESPATTSMGNDVVVKGNERYKLKCMDGYHFPAGSPYEKNNEQILICDNNSGKLKDVSNGNQLVDGPAKCIKTTGPGCADLVQQNTKVISEICPDGKKNAANCTITLQCQPGFIPVDPAYHTTGKLTLSCKDGNDWVDSITGKTITSGLECKPACRIDSSATNPSAEITKNSNKTVTVDNIMYVEEGAVVVITCKGDEVMWDSDSSKTPNPHDFTCAGGKTGWKREDDSKLVMTLGEGCVKTCPPLTLDPSTTVRQFTSPKVIEYNGKQYVAEGQSYTFKCANDKYQYPQSSPNTGNQQETAKCDGSKRNYVSPINGKPFTKPEECSRKEGLDECPRLLQNTSVTIAITGSSCNNDGDYYPTGCEITIKCKQGYYPSDKTYLNPTGEQKLVCRAGGNGWADQENKKIIEGLNCVKGCVNASAATSNSETTTLKEIFKSPKGVEAICESKTKTTIVTGTLPDHPYYCPVDNKNDTSYYDKECTNACRELPRPLPLGVTIFKGPEYTIPNKTYTFAEEQYILKCAAGYVYPKGSKQRDQGRQTLVCDGTTNKYNDVDDGRKGIQPLACEEAKGCSEIKQPKEAEVSKSGCSFNDPYYNDKCELTINCQNGFYPKDLDALVNQGQKIVCNEEKDTWTTVGGEPIKTAIECIQGCKEINLKEYIEWNNSTERNTILTFYNLDGKQYKCIAGTLLEKAIAQIKKSLNDNNRYYCKKTELKTEDIVNLIVDDTVCQDTCPLKTFNLPNGVVLDKTPNSFIHEEIKMVAKDASFTFHCKEGYQYNPKSPYASGKKQDITCVGNGSYFDPLTNAINPQVQPCEKIIGCTPPSPSEGVRAVKDPSCVVSANIAVPPCKYTMECEQGYYPLMEDYQKKPNQSIVCTNGVATANWNDAASQKSTTPLTCAKGCLPKPKLGSDTQTNKDTQVETYILSGAGAVVCVSTTVNSSTTENYKAVDLPFYCPTNESSTMTNFTNTPCTNACSNITYASTLIPKPPTLLIKGLVPNGYTWMLSCPGDKVFSDTKAKSREFQCDGSTKTYNDLSPSGKTRIINVDDNCIAPEVTTTTTTTTTTIPPTTTTTTTTTPTTTTPSPCSSPSSNGIDFKKGAAGQKINDGDTIEIACKPGFSPAEPSLYSKPSQTLKCSGGKLIDSSDPTNGNPKVLSCNEGCVKRQYNVTETSSDTSSTTSTVTLPYAPPNEAKRNVTVTCSASKMTTSATRQLIGEEHKYLCDDNLGSTVKFENGSFSPCTNACLAPLPGDSGVSKTLAVKRQASPFAQLTKFKVNGVVYDFVLDKEKVEVSCATPGEKFSNDPSASSLTMVCDSKTGQFSDSATGKPLYPSNSLPTCGNTPNPKPSDACPSLPSTATYTVRKQSCGDVFDGEKTGCKIFIVCTSNPDAVKSLWECQSNKQWKSLKDGSSVANLPVPSC